MSKPMEYIWPGIIAAQAIHAATKLGIADLLSSGPRAVTELAVDSGAHPPSLECLLRALSTLGIFGIAPDGRFCNTPLSDVLRADHPQSQRASTLFLPAAFLWRPLGELPESVRTGEPAFQRIFGERFFDYLASHQDDAATFNAVMTEGISWTSSALLAAYDFSRFRQLVDVGGGEGALLRDILSATPGTRAVLQVFRALVYVACLWPLIRMLRGARWETALAMALFLSVWTTALLLPNPMMPSSVARSHFWETLGFSLVFGALTGWLLCGRNQVDAAQTVPARS